jgi:hypothetical protein
MFEETPDRVGRPATRRVPWTLMRDLLLMTAVPESKVACA